MWYNSTIMDREDIDFPEEENKLIKVTVGNKYFSNNLILI